MRESQSFDKQSSDSEWRPSFPHSLILSVITLLLLVSPCITHAQPFNNNNDGDTHSNTDIANNNNSNSNSNNHNINDDVNKNNNEWREMNCPRSSHHPVSLPFEQHSNTPIQASPLKLQSSDSPDTMQPPPPPQQQQQQQQQQQRQQRQQQQAVESTSSSSSPWSTSSSSSSSSSSYSMHASSSSPWLYESWKMSGGSSSSLSPRGIPMYSYPIGPQEHEHHLYHNPFHLQQEDQTKREGTEGGGTERGRGNATVYMASSNDYRLSVLKERQDEVQSHPHTFAVDRQVMFSPMASFERFNLDEQQPQQRYVEIRNNQLYVNNQKFWIQGICYSPVPVGESVNFPPFGDYFTPDYAWIWQRDLPLIKAMGATVIRIYGWKNNVDHTIFLDAVHAVGLKVLVTYYLGNAQETPVSTEEQRNQVITDFVAQVYKYRDHPAILMWSFGNELNGWWNKFVTQFSDAFGCWWGQYCAGYQDINSDCHWQSSCAYFHLYRWMNAAAKAAKVVTDRPIISGMADVDFMVGTDRNLDKVARFDYLIPDLDAWAIQLYRGYSFGGYFQMYRAESWKPMIVTEFGIDAYNDPCGWPENNLGQGCFNLPGDGMGGDVAPPGRGFSGCNRWDMDCSKPGVQSQKEWDMRLAGELMGNYADSGGVVLGGFLMAWTDEYWKGVGTQDFCWHPCPVWDIWNCRTNRAAEFHAGGSAGCTYKAHFTCSNYDTQFHDLCGYYLQATPDSYVNEEWFGITSPIQCWRNDVDGVHRLNSLYIRPAFIGLMLLWSGNWELDTSFTTCESLSGCWECSTSKSMDELLDGGCLDVCAVKAAAVGPGSSQIHFVGGPNFVPTDFWGKYGTPILVGAAAFMLALIASACLVCRRWQQSPSEETMRLLPK